MNNIFIYIHKNSLYINLTNRCTNNCDFCIRKIMDGIDGYDLWLKKEPDFNDITQQLANYDIKSYDEIIFCGFGEPMLRLEVLLQVSRYIKNNYKNMKIRINTNGQANLYYDEDIIPKLSGLIDTLSISMNAPDAKEYDKMCHSDYGEAAFDGVINFAKLSKRYVPHVRLSIVDIIGEEKIKKCREITEANDLELYIRKKI